MKVSVVVANHNRDITKLKESLPLHVEFIEINMGMERSAQRNIGIQRATGDIVIWLDSDQYLSDGLVDEIKDKIRCGYTAVYIPETITTKGFFGYLRNWERQFYTGTAIDVPRAVLRSHCPLFDETMSGPEDSDWGNRIKGMKATTKRCLYHQDDEKFISFLKKKAYYSKSMARYKEKWPDDKVLKFWWRCFGVFFEDGKYKRVLRRPDLFICVMGLIFLRGVIYYANR